MFSLFILFSCSNKKETLKKKVETIVENSLKENSNLKNLDYNIKISEKKEVTIIFKTELELEPKDLRDASSLIFLALEENIPHYKASIILSNNNEGCNDIIFIK